MNDVFLLGNLVADPRTFDTKNGPGATVELLLIERLEMWNELFTLM